MTFCSRLKPSLEPCLKPSSLFSKNGVLWNSESLSFNTAKISHHFGHENKSQKNTALPYWMKLLVVRVEKSEVCKSFLHCYSSRRRIWFASASTIYVGQLTSADLLCTRAASSSLDPRQVRLQASKSFNGPKTL